MDVLVNYFQTNFYLNRSLIVSRAVNIIDLNGNRAVKIPEKNTNLQNLRGEIKKTPSLDRRKGILFGPARGNITISEVATITLNSIVVKVF